MNGARSTYMRKGYLLTALAVAVLLAASSGTAWAQRVTIGFDGTSGEVSEEAYVDPNSLVEPLKFKVRVTGLRGGASRAGDITASLKAVTITPSAGAYISVVNARGTFIASTTEQSDTAVFTIPITNFDNSDEVVLVVAQSMDGDTVGDPDWKGEKIELKLGVTGTASVSPDVYTLQVVDTDLAPEAKFVQSSFTLEENSSRSVQLDVAAGRRGASIPTAAQDAAVETGVITVRVSNHDVVTLGTCPRATDPTYNRTAIRLDLDTATDWEDTSASFASTGLLRTQLAISALADGAAGAANVTADIEVSACGDRAGLADPQITLTILERNLTEPTRANGPISIGSPLTITVASNESAPTLSFSPTDVTIDEGGSTNTVLLAEGMNSGEVGMVKLMVEGDAMVDLYQDGEMLEEMDGYVMVDLDGSSAARLMAMSLSDPDLMDGEMAHKAWKLMEGGTDGANIGEGYWFKVVVRGSTAVPALPLVGQLLLALFLMAGGARLYRRRQG